MSCDTQPTDPPATETVAVETREKEEKDMTTRPFRMPLAKRDGWTVYQEFSDTAPGRTPLRVRHASWSRFDCHAIAIRHLAPQMRVLDAAVKRGMSLAASGGVHEINADAVPVVRDLVRSALPTVLRETTAADWASTPPADYGGIVKLLEDLGVDPKIFLGADR